MILFHKLYIYLNMLIYQINWSPDEVLIEILGFSIYVYSLMFILAFFVGFKLFQSFFIKENVDQKYLDPMLVYMVISIFLGARLGEVFFYQWGYYQNHLVEILLPIQESPNSSLLGLIDGYEFTGYRGLASHGASIGVFIGLYLFIKRYNFKNFLWIFDRLTIPISIGGAFVRIGNFFNSEILGKYTDSNWGIIFENRETEMIIDMETKNKLTFYLSSDNLRSVFILSNSKTFLSSPLSTLPDGNFNF